MVVVENLLNRIFKDGGFWNVDECVFKVMFNKWKENNKLVVLYKMVCCMFGVIWFKIKYSDLRWFLYFVLVVRIILEMIECFIFCGLRN